MKEVSGIRLWDISKSVIAYGILKSKKIELTRVNLLKAKNCLNGKIRFENIESEFHLQVKKGRLKGVVHEVSVIKHCRRFYATNAGNNVSRQQILRNYKTRWGIEDFFRSLKQLCHIKECKSRKIEQQRRFFFLSMQAFMLLQSMNKNTIYEAKLDFQQKFMGRKINGDKALRLLTA